MIDQRLGMLRVPLQGARKAWVVEAGQGLVQLRTEPAQLSHQVWLHVLETGQRLAFDVIEQPQAQWLFVDVQFQQPHAVVGQAYGGYRQTLLAQEGQGGVLRFKFQLGIAAMAGLQHIATLGRGHAKVQVLLAAQHRKVAGNAVVGLKHGVGLGFAQRWAGPAGALYQRGQGRGSGLVLWAGHGSTVGTWG
ncbi:hypothetical protein D3C79_725740 [compost metagenome]